jgi:pimeloyl-ACP methyl ester carboxylesterase
MKSIQLLMEPLLLALLVLRVDGFTPFDTRRSVRELGFQSHVQAKTSFNVEEVQTTIKSYSFRDWNLTYRHKELPNRRYKKDKGSSIQSLQKQDSSSKTTVILIHPVGIGINSWFWRKLMDTWQDDDDQSFDIIAPDLIGCGISNGGDAWDQSIQPLSFPLGWVQGIEPLLPTSGKCLVVVQGGLAPVGVLLAARHPNIVTNLVLCSPPTYQEMTTAVPESELERNFRFLTDPRTANPAFWILEQQWAVRFFSNTFLFANPCDDEWVQQAMVGTQSAEGISAALVRNPVAAFNAGFCQHRSFEEELTTLTQPTLILSGRADKRDRQGYVDAMQDCTWAQMPNCCNVLPWEDPVQVRQAIQEFADFHNGRIQV